MKDKIHELKKVNIKLVAIAALLLAVIIIASIGFCGKYVQKSLLRYNENGAINVALMIQNNFTITDEEVAHMKSLTFNEMQSDPINQRLAEVATGIDFKEPVISIYVVAPLKEDEIKYVLDSSNADFWSAEEGTPLDSVWLLNMAVDENGNAVFKQREDIYRYTVTTEEIQKGYDAKEAYGVHSQDEWGNVITGYVPIYTVEGNYVGILGVDFDISNYYSDIYRYVVAMVSFFVIAIVIFTGISFWLYKKNEKEQQERFESEHHNEILIREEKEANQAKTDFLSRMSHDMRTPMNGILGLVHLMQDKDISEDIRSDLEQITLSGQYLLNLINDTLDINKIESDKLELKPIPTSTANITKNILTTVKMNAADKGVNLTICKENNNLLEDKIVNIDSARVEQIFMNLVSNAVKFTPAGGDVNLTIERLEETEEYISDRYIIRDTGIGMSQEFQKHLFEPFAQEGRLNTNRESGTGLGLSIVHRLISMMDGTLEIESEINKGTTCIVEMKFPIYHGNLQSETDLIAEEVSLEGKHILLCEDHPLNQQIAKALLEKKGMNVDCAENGMEGLDMFCKSASGAYDLILMDIRMPLMDGLETTREIRKSVHADAKIIPIIAMTANAFDSDIEECMQAGMNAHLAKPIDVDRMYQIIGNYVSGPKI